jgi:hypothetical protein
MDNIRIVPRNRGVAESVDLTSRTARLALSGRQSVRIGDTGLQVPATRRSNNRAGCVPPSRVPHSSRRRRHHVARGRGLILQLRQGGSRLLACRCRSPEPVRRAQERSASLMLAPASLISTTAPRTSRVTEVLAWVVAEEGDPRITPNRDDPPSGKAGGAREAGSPLRRCLRRRRARGSEPPTPAEGDDPLAEPRRCRGRSGGDSRPQRRRRSR